jgi:hypothetical protein
MAAASHTHPLLLHHHHHIISSSSKQRSEISRALRKRVWVKS